ncbi:AAA family ATPase [Gordonia aichiensis]|uniref:Clp family protein n=1 Tax=Gordonia aichiensis NBRC 108223 TaxID=1220583 RepID=L7KRQ8_9ACTN|nr:AAA family ATPase [Gordonia aichiensis]GAC50398.1 Clp family protein [Gordonia aichiensis NBRC 108223]
MTLAHADRTTPTWIREVDIALAANPQVVLTGNLRDFVLIPTEKSGGPPYRSLDITSALVHALSQAGHQNIVSFNPAEGLGILSEQGQVASTLIRDAEKAAGSEASLTRQLRVLIRLVASAENSCCLVIEGASRLRAESETFGGELHELLVTAERALLTAVRHRVAGSHRTPLYNTVFWMVDREGDLPHWIVGNDLVRVISIPLPSLGDRRNLIRPLINSLPNAVPIPFDHELDEASTKLIDRYAGLTGGLTLRSINEINRLAIDRGIPGARIEDAVRTYRVGIPDNPWHDPALKAKIREAAATLNRSVLGQPAAVRKTVDILIRSTMGLTGAQTASSGGRPQGVLFFAGPTGVGKTELAKSVAELVFGRKDAFLRFDMSEFAHEGAEARLIGAPPGYIGHNAGGELTNAVRQQPFRLILFDEVEKAHPQIFDKFLQILEDGRLTDGNGSTVYFSEALIVFTSNLGVYTVGPDGLRTPRITRGAGYREVETTIRAAVAEHFTRDLGRPEILNRIGENVVVFDFVSEDVGNELVDVFVTNIGNRVRETTGARLVISDEAIQTLKSGATQNLDFGGRGVANVVEAMLINPLARAMFDLPTVPPEVVVTRIKRSGEAWNVWLR